MVSAEDGESDRIRRRRRRELVVVAIAIALSIGLIVPLGLVVFTVPPSTGCEPCGSPEPALSSAVAGSTYNGSGNTYHPYDFSIQSAGTGLEARNLMFRLQDANGTDFPFVFVGLVDVSACWIGSYTMSWTAGIPNASPPGASPCGSMGPNLTSQVSSGDQLILVTSRSISGQGYSLVLTGQGTFEGSVAAAIP